MSLDLHIKSKTPILKHGTGVYVREDGRNRELESLAEVRKYFPDADISHIKEFDYETDDMWHGNITHNMTEMADHVPISDLTLYDYLWRPEEHGFKIATIDYMNGVYEGLSYLKSHKSELLQYEPEVDPETGKRWGDYNLLVRFCASLINCLMELDFSKKYKIVSSV